MRFTVRHELLPANRKRLGHVTPGFAMATYQHLRPGMQADAPRVFADLIASTGFNPVRGSVEAVSAR